RSGSWIAIYWGEGIPLRWFLRSQQLIQRLTQLFGACMNLLGQGVVRAAHQRRSPVGDLVEPRPQLLSGKRHEQLIARSQHGDRLALLMQGQLVLDPRQHLLDLKWLGDIVHPADLKRLDLIEYIVKRADEDHWDMPGLLVALELAADFVAVHTGHLHIQ